jgi:hypothetical protein
MDTSSTDSSSVQIISYDKTKPILSHVTDLFTAYGLCPSGLSDDEINKIINNISQNKKTFPYLQEAIYSNRYPYTIMTISAKIGMFIPPRKRVGLDSYLFFLANIKCYEATFERVGQHVPTLYEIYMAKDKVGLLMKFRDDEILKSNYKFSRNYSTRKEMIENFIENNINVYGQFTLENNCRTIYSTKAKTITYTEKENKCSYNSNEFLQLIDLQRGVVWKNLKENLVFSQLSLHNLRQQILEKCNQWKNRDYTTQYNGPPELYNILISLENLLINDVRNDISAYLGTPVLKI